MKRKKNEKVVGYEKPFFEKQSGMTFPIQIIEKYNGGRFCLQCAGCHGCR